MYDMQVSIVVIALNSSNTISLLFECLRKQTYPPNLVEVILIDGLSDDNTKKKMFEFQRTEDSFKRIAVLDNPKKTLPCGWNIALEEIQGEAVLRVDAHSTFPDDFIEQNVKDLGRNEDICGGKVISLPADKTRWNIVLNEAENSMFGGSFAAFRHADSPRYVSTAAFAIYRTSVFDKVGKYNEILTRTEDNEMHYRMRKAGYKIFYDPEIVSYRATRSSLGRLLKQKFQNGYWIGRTLGIEPHCFSLYHFVPLAFVLAIIATIFIAFTGIFWTFAILWIVYFTVNFVMAMHSAVRCKDRNISFVCLPALFLLLHICYGIGTISGVFQIYKNKGLK